MSPTHLEIIPLGGLGEFGMNMMIYRWGDDSIIVDAGMMFPGSEHPGVNVIVPDLSALEGCPRVHGLILTHGHDDHVGAVPWLLASRDLPVYATPHTLALVRRRLEEHPQIDTPRLLPLVQGDTLSLGPFQIEAIVAGHSIPQSRMLLIRTPLGNVVHTADFKLDPHPPDGAQTDLGRLAEIGREGVLALCSDSTNADQPGFTAGELTVTRGIDSVLASSERRVLVTIFASHISRLEQLGQLARKHGRRLALVGSSLQAHAEIAERLGLLHLPAQLRLSGEAVMALPPRHALIVASGSQAESSSSMTRIAAGQHREIQLAEGDRVIHSARVIPGSARAIGRMINGFLRRGVEVITAADAPVHVSGHPSQEELRVLIQLLRPRYLLPIHGEYRQLHSHARLAVQGGLAKDAVCIAETGDVVALDARSISVVDRISARPVFIGSDLASIDPALLRERRRFAGDGVVIAVVALDAAHQLREGYPRLLTRGVAGADDGPDGVLESVGAALDAALRRGTPSERGDSGWIESTVQTELRRQFRRGGQGEPLILPVVVEA